MNNANHNDNNDSRRCRPGGAGLQGPQQADRGADSDSNHATTTTTTTTTNNNNTTNNDTNNAAGRSRSGSEQANDTMKQAIAMSMSRSLSLSIYIYICICVHIYIYIYTHVYIHTIVPSKILDFRRFDSSTILILRGGILRSIGELPGKFESTNLRSMKIVRTGPRHSAERFCASRLRGAMRPLV